MSDLRFPASEHRYAPSTAGVAGLVSQPRRRSQEYVFSIFALGAHLGLTDPFTIRRLTPSGLQRELAGGGRMARRLSDRSCALKLTPIRQGGGQSFSALNASVAALTGHAAFSVDRASCGRPSLFHEGAERTVWRHSATQHGVGKRCALPGRRNDEEQDRDSAKKTRQSRGGASYGLRPAFVSPGRPCEPPGTCHRFCLRKSCGDGAFLLISFRAARLGSSCQRQYRRNGLGHYRSSRSAG